VGILNLISTRFVVRDTARVKYIRLLLILYFLRYSMAAKPHLLSRTRTFDQAHVIILKLSR
jgi:hypothetical protein